MRVGPHGAVVAEGFASRLSFGILSFALPLYAYRLGMNIAAIGLLLSLNLAVAVVLKPVSGWLTDHVGVRRTYLAAVMLRSVVVLALIVAAAPWQLFAIRALHGVSIALRDPAATTVLAAIGGREAVAQRFGWYQTAKTVAGSAGRFAAGVLITVTLDNFTVVFAVAFVLSALPLAVVSRQIRGPELEGIGAERGRLVDKLLGRLTDRLLRARRPARRTVTVMPFAGLGVLASGTTYMMANLLPILAVDYAGLSAAAAGSLNAITALIALTGPAWGWISDRFGPRSVLLLRGGANVASSVLYLVAPTYGGLLAGKAVDDTGKAAFRPAWGALMAHAADQDPQRRARTVSWLSAGDDLGEALGPVIAGLIWSLWGIPALLVSRALLAVATEVYAARVVPEPTWGYTPQLSRSETAN
jgi:MFS family permease